jgi:hypothetical protein
LDRRGRKFLIIKKFGSGSALCGQASAPIDLATPSGRHRYRSWLGGRGGRRGVGRKGSGREDLVDRGLRASPVNIVAQWGMDSNATSKDSEVLYSTEDVVLACCQPA